MPITLALADRPDRRRERTREAIRIAFRDEFQERGFARLTIGGVIARANIGRSTFYEHFKTKSDVLVFSLAAPLGPLAEIIGSDQPSSTLLPLLAHFRHNASSVRSLFAGPARSIVARALAAKIAERLDEIASGTEPVVPMTMIATQIAQAQLAVVEHWTLGRVACSAEAVAKALFASTNAIAGALTRSDQAPAAMSSSAMASTMEAASRR